MKSCKALLLCLVAISLLVSASACRQPSAADNYPNKPVELVTHNAAGGALDVLGRLFIDIVQQGKFLEQPLVLTTKAGTSGAAAFGYLVENKGDAYKFMIQNSSILLSTPLTEKVPYDYKTFTPIANTLTDAQVMVVSSDSPYKTVDDFIADAQKRPNELSQSMVNVTSGGPQLAREMMALKNVKWKLVSFASNPESVQAVLAGTVTSTIISPSATIEQVRAGKLRPLLSTAPSRYAGLLANVPTAGELKLGTPHVINRGFWGPPAMPDYAVKKIEGMLKKVYDSDRFKKYAEDNVMLMNWQPGPEFAKALDVEFQDVKKGLEETGRLK